MTKTSTFLRPFIKDLVEKLVSSASETLDKNEMRLDQMTDAEGRFLIPNSVIKSKPLRIQVYGMEKPFLDGTVPMGISDGVHFMKAYLTPECIQRFEEDSTQTEQRYGAFIRALMHLSVYKLILILPVKNKEMDVYMRIEEWRHVSGDKDDPLQEPKSGSLQYVLEQTAIKSIIQIIRHKLKQNPSVVIRDTNPPFARLQYVSGPLQPAQHMQTVGLPNVLQPNHIINVEPVPESEQTFIQQPHHVDYPYTEDDFLNKIGENGRHHAWKDFKFVDADLHLIQFKALLRNRTAPGRLEGGMANCQRLLLRNLNNSSSIPSPTSHSQYWRSPESGTIGQNMKLGMQLMEQSREPLQLQNNTGLSTVSKTDENQEESGYLGTIENDLDIIEDVEMELNVEKIDDLNPNTSPKPENNIGQVEHQVDPCLRDCHEDYVEEPAIENNPPEESVAPISSNINVKSTPPLLEENLHHPCSQRSDTNEHEITGMCTIDSSKPAAQGPKETIDKIAERSQGYQAHQENSTKENVYTDKLNEVAIFEQKGESSTDFVSEGATECDVESVHAKLPGQPGIKEDGSWNSAGASSLNSPPPGQLHCPKTSPNDMALCDKSPTYIISLTNQSSVGASLTSLVARSNPLLFDTPKFIRNLIQNAVTPSPLVQRVLAPASSSIAKSKQLPVRFVDRIDDQDIPSFVTRVQATTKPTDLQNSPTLPNTQVKVSTIAQVPGAGNEEFAPSENKTCSFELKSTQTSNNGLISPAGEVLEPFLLAQDLHITPPKENPDYEKSTGPSPNLMENNEAAPVIEPLSGEHEGMMGFDERINNGGVMNINIENLDLQLESQNHAEIAHASCILDALAGAKELGIMSAPTRVLTTQTSTAAVAAPLILSDEDYACYNLVSWKQILKCEYRNANRVAKADEHRRQINEAVFEYISGKINKEIAMKCQLELPNNKGSVAAVPKKLLDDDFYEWFENYARSSAIPGWILGNRGDSPVDSSDDSENEGLPLKPKLSVFERDALRRLGVVAKLEIAANDANADLEQKHVDGSTSKGNASNGKNVKGQSSVSTLNKSFKPPFNSSIKTAEQPVSSNKLDGDSLLKESPSRRLGARPGTLKQETIAKPHYYTNTHVDRRHSSSSNLAQVTERNAAVSDSASKSAGNSISDQESHFWPDSTKAKNNDSAHTSVSTKKRKRADASHSKIPKLSRHQEKEKKVKRKVPEKPMITDNGEDVIDLTCSPSPPPVLVKLPITTSNPSNRAPIPVLKNDASYFNKTDALGRVKMKTEVNDASKTKIETSPK